MKIKCLKHIMYITVTVWNRHKDTPKPETIQKPADFLLEEEATPGPSTECRETTREKNRGGNVIDGSIRFL